MTSSVSLFTVVFCISRCRRRPNFIHVGPVSLLWLKLSSSLHVTASGLDKTSLTLSHAAVVSFINLLRTILICRPPGLLCVLLIRAINDCSFAGKPDFFPQRTTSKIERLVTKVCQLSGFPCSLHEAFSSSDISQIVQFDVWRKFSGLNIKATHHTECFEWRWRLLSYGPN